MERISADGDEDQYRCNNYVSEVKYEIELRAEEGKYLINAVKIILTQDSTANSFLNTANIQLEQRFVVEFFTTAARNDGTRDVEKYSGNPGYLTGFPVLLAHYEAAAEDKDIELTVYEDGFRLVGVENDGSCSIQGVGEIAQSGPIVNFQQNVVHGCTYTLSNEVEDFKAECEKQPVFELNVAQILAAGEYGNANVDYLNVR